MSDRLTILQGDWIEQLRTLPDESVQCCVTSPPYWGLRNYGVEGQLGLEKTPEEYISKLVTGFLEIRRVLKSDGTLWLNLGDCFHDKKLVGIQWRVALELQVNGWYLRSDIVWAKANCMPESVTDRPTRSHEFIFLFSRSKSYYYDHESIKEPCIYDVDGTGTAARKARAAEGLKSHPEGLRAGIRPGGYKNSVNFNGKNHRQEKQRGHSRRHSGFNDRWDKMEHEEQCTGMRNKRDVWTVAPANYPDAHFATYPPELIKPCILAGARAGDVVLDPFGGSGTTGMVALELGRKALLIELNPEYVKLIEKRCFVTPGLPL